MNGREAHQLCVVVFLKEGSTCSHIHTAEHSRPRFEDITMGRKLGFFSNLLHKHKNMQLLEKCCSFLWEIIMIQIAGVLALQNKEVRNFS